MSDQHEDDLVAKVARALCIADCRDPDEEVVASQCAGFQNFGPLWQANERSENTLGGRNYVSDARAALEASGITDLTRQLTKAREALEKGMAINSQNCRGFAEWQAETAALNPEQTKS